MIDEDDEEDVIEDVYDVAIRNDTQLQRAPLQRYVTTQLSRMSNEAAFWLHESRGLGPGILEAFVEKVKRSCRKLVQKLSYMDTLWVEPAVPAWSGGTSSSSLRTPAGSSQPVIGVTSVVRTQPYHSAGKDPASEDDEDDDDPLELSQTARPMGRLVEGRDRHVSARWCTGWYPRSLTCSNKGYEPYATATRPHRHWLHS
ncbi:uncharacterized protein [Miscanthus floridulus]|uniref:uncharacterized protein n=1 Tax=Miscanthus floridulus TaxID=154761 RepID=UPI0034595C7F